MKAEVIKEFRGTPDNATTERGIAVGEIIYGDLAKQAVKAGNAKKVAAGKAKKG